MMPRFSLDAENRGIIALLLQLLPQYNAVERLAALRRLPTGAHAAVCSNEVLDLIAPPKEPRGRIEAELQAAVAATFGRDGDGLRPVLARLELRPPPTAQWLEAAMRLAVDAELVRSPDGLDDIELLYDLERLAGNAEQPAHAREAAHRAARRLVHAGSQQRLAAVDTAAATAAVRAAIPTLRRICAGGKTEPYRACAVASPANYEKETQGCWGGPRCSTFM